MWVGVVRREIQKDFDLLEPERQPAARIEQGKLESELSLQTVHVHDRRGIVARRRAQCGEAVIERERDPYAASLLELNARQPQECAHANPAHVIRADVELGLFVDVEHEREPVLTELLQKRRAQKALDTVLIQSDECVVALSAIGSHWLSPWIPSLDR